METQALIFMVSAEAIITGLTLYFFIRVVNQTSKSNLIPSYTQE